MRTHGLVILAFAIGLAVVAAPRDARACGDGGNGALVVAALGVGAVYTGTTVGFAAYDLAADDPSRTYGIVETAVNVPLMLAFGSMAIDELEYSRYGDANDEELAVYTGLALVHAALTIHGIHTIARDRDEPPPGTLVLGRVRGRVVPAPVGDGRSTGAGLGLVGHF